MTVNQKAQRYHENDWFFLQVLKGQRQEPCIAASTIKSTCLHHEDITEHEETKNEHGGVGKWQAVIKEEEKRQWEIILQRP